MLAWVLILSLSEVTKNVNKIFEMGRKFKIEKTNIKCNATMFFY